MPVAANTTDYLNRVDSQYIFEATKMAMDKIDIAKAKTIAKNKGLTPGKVKGTDGVQFTKGKNPRVEPCSWEEFEDSLKKRKLAIYESGGWMKIMKA